MPQSSDMPRQPLPLTLVVCATRSNGIGKSGALPWRLKSEMAHFVRVTKGAPEGKVNAVVMGRKSWQAIPDRFRPLKGRRNVVVTRGDGAQLGVAEAADSHLAGSLSEACEALAAPSDDLPLHRAFLIGGAQLYAHALTTPSPAYSADRILMTRIKSPDFDCDVHFPEIRPGEPGALQGWRKCDNEELEQWMGPVKGGDVTEEDVTYEFEMWRRDQRDEGNFASEL